MGQERASGRRSRRARREATAHWLAHAVLWVLAFAASPAFAFPPFFITAPPTAVAENQPYTYTFAAFDLDFDTLLYGAPVLPSFLAFNGVNTISGTPLAAHIGTHSSQRYGVRRNEHHCAEL